MVGCAVVFMSFHAILMLFGSKLIENHMIFLVKYRG